MLTLLPWTPVTKLLLLYMNMGCERANAGQIKSCVRTKLACGDVPSLVASRKVLEQNGDGALIICRKK